MANKGGRPKKSLNEDQMRQLETLASALSLEQIADYFGMSKVTFYAIMDREPEVSERYKRGKARAIAGVAGNLINQAKNGNTSAAIFYLKTQAGWRETDREGDANHSIAEALANVIDKLPQ